MGFYKELANYQSKFPIRAGNGLLVGETDSLMGNGSTRIQILNLL